MFTNATMAGGSLVGGNPPSPYDFDSFLSAFISGRTGYFCAPLYVPQPARLPQLTYARTDRQRAHQVGGSLGFVTATYDIVSWATDYQDASVMSDAVYSVLDCFSGDLQYNGETMRVEWAQFERDIPQYNPPVDNSSIGVHSIIATYTIIYREAKPNNGR